MTYTAKQAIITLDEYLGINDSQKEYIDNTKNRGFVLSLNSGERIVIFVYPLVHKQDDTKTYFDTRDSGPFERGVTWNYAITNKLKYFCIGVNNSVNKYTDYAFSLECREEVIVKISGTSDGQRNESYSGNQIIIPNYFVPNKPFERIKNKLGIFIAAIHKNNLMDYFETYDNRPYMVGSDTVGLSNPLETSKNNLEEIIRNNNYDDIFSHNLYGIHIKEKNNALSETDPHICIGWSKMGDLSDIKDKQALIELYDQYFEKNNRGKAQDIGQIWRFINDMQIGDYVIFAENSLFHIGQIKSDYYYDNTKSDSQDENYTNIRKVTWIKRNISRSVLSDNLHNSLKAAMTVWTLNDYKSVVAELLRDTYVKNSIFYNDNDNIATLKTCLEIKRKPREDKVHPINFIVYGAPGTGKTYSMVEYALAISKNIALEKFREDNKDREKNVSLYKELVKAGQVVFTTFHQNYGYEEFVQGLRPDKDSDTIAFKTVDGVFKNIADAALNDTEGKNFIIIIDEINRANISKVFGELITLIEEDKRWGELNETSAILQSGDVFAVPNNLYIIGTMNSADKSISLIDAALRRRFDFIEQKPDSSLVQDSVLRAMLENINTSLAKELDSTDLLVGHSYFMNKIEGDLCNILNNNIIPLLYEYFYDNRKKVANLLNAAIKKSGANVEIVDEKVGRLRVKEVKHDTE